MDAGESSPAARSVLVAVDALLRAGRVDAAIRVLEMELGGGC